MNDETIKAMLSSASEREAAFRSIISGTKRRIYGLARKMVGDHALADEVVQRTYIKVFRKIDHFQWKSSIESWVYRIALHTALDLVRQEKRRRTVGLDGVVAGRTAEPVGYEEALDAVRTAVELLPPRQKEVFVMRFYEDLSFEEIARRLEASASGMRSTYAHAKRKIKEEMIAKDIL